MYQIWSQLTELKGSGYGHAVIDDVEVMPLKINNPDTTRVLMYASRMFHSLGTVQSKTAVPVGTSKSLSGIRSPIRSVLPYPVARDATAYGVKTAGEAVQLAAELRAIFHFELT